MHTTNAMNIISLVVQIIEGWISEVQIIEGVLYHCFALCYIFSSFLFSFVCNFPLPMKIK